MSQLQKNIEPKRLFLTVNEWNEVWAAHRYGGQEPRMISKNYLSNRQKRMTTKLPNSNETKAFKVFS